MSHMGPTRCAEPGCRRWVAEAGANCGLPHDDPRPASHSDCASRLFVRTIPDASLVAAAHAAFDETDDTICVEIARRTTSGAALHWLARHPCPAVRRAVAARPNLWLTTQGILADDPDLSVADTLAANPTVAVGLAATADTAHPLPAQGGCYTPQVPSHH